MKPGGDHLQDGFLQAREIARLDLNAEQVVLSACGSARDGKAVALRLAKLARRIPFERGQATFQRKVACPKAPG